MARGNILVIGGCGFLGFHIVGRLLESQEWSSVHVMSRNPSQNRHKGAQYHAASLSSTADTVRVLENTQPMAIIHCASLLAFGTDVHEEQFSEVNVVGTRNILDCARSRSSVRAFVYTSTTSVMEGATHDSTKEDARLWTANSQAEPYARSKAIADQMVMDANSSGGFRTVCIRVPVIYGERDHNCIPKSLKALDNAQYKIQIGGSASRTEHVSVTNATTAHILALNALLDGGTDSVAQKVNGEAFFITDGQPINFWDFHRKVWAAAGHEHISGQAKIIPAWFALGLASTIEWLYWILTMGTKKPATLRRHLLEYTCSQRTFSIEKARSTLGYEPVNDRDEQIRKGIEWHRTAMRESK